MLGYLLDKHPLNTAYFIAGVICFLASALRLYYGRDHEARQALRKVMEEALGYMAAAIACWTVTFTHGTLKSNLGDWIVVIACSLGASVSLVIAISCYRELRTLPPPTATTPLR